MELFTWTAADYATDGSEKSKLHRACSGETVILVSSMLETSKLPLKWPSAPHKLVS